MRAYELFKKKFGTTVDQSQIINWIWYDSLQYTSGTTTLLTFFNAVRATRDIGNMELAGTLANPKAFIIRAIRVYFEVVPAVVAAGAPDIAGDIQLLINTSRCELNIGNKNYGIWPTHALPGGSGVYAQTAAAGGEAGNEFLTTTASHGIPDPRAVYSLSMPLMIEPQINFDFNIQWPAAQTLSANPVIMVMLDGELLRPVQ